VTGLDKAVAAYQAWRTAETTPTDAEAATLAEPAQPKGTPAPPAVPWWVKALAVAGGVALVVVLVGRKR
jgi:hypothetical protein